MKNLKKFSIIFIFCSINLIASQIKHIHFLIPGGANGGWDKTARNVGKALIQSNLLTTASYENMSGSGGGKALSYLIETAQTQKSTLMVNSTPIVIRSLQKSFSKSFKDLTLVAAIIADYQVLVVNKDSLYKRWEDVLLYSKKNSQKIKVGGGSSRGGMDHLVAIQIFKSAGTPIKNIRYISHDAGGEALSSLLKGDIDILSTGLGEVLEEHKKGNVQIIGVSSKHPIKEDLSIPTFKSLGVDVAFANWRGFFGAPNLEESRVIAIQSMLKKMLLTPQWDKIKTKNGWNNLYKEGKEFESFLKEQENSIGSVIKELGVL